MKSDINYQLVAEMISKLETKIDERFDKLECNFVSIDRFAPVEKIAYGFVGIILVAFISALIYLIAKDPSVLAK